ncbi:glycosyl hydrolase superfamily protein [Actinidia rufa]|uniref:mannan endo-1,4-beta-mannosidase n=1 Tax=Actinidia rufa TaxID=165716 RepID=A0A7J0DUW4_9ERIC|nr:glycosyl hydrolase superfamily protein [Actinidia rufa]
MAEVKFRCFVGGLAWATGDRSLKNAFAQFGDIIESKSIELQISPSRYDEHVFRALDHVITEAGQHGIRMLLSLVNNLQAYGGKTQYVQWAWEEGVGLSSSNDSFFYDPSIRHYFKNHVKDDLKKAYRKAAIKNHPDKGGDPEEISRLFCRSL